MNRRTLLQGSMVGLLAGGEAAAAKPRPRPVAIISEEEMHAAVRKRGERGRPVVLHLWASWCMPCVHELPLVGELARESQRRGYYLYSVSLDDPAAAAKVARLLDEKGASAMTRAIVRFEDPDAFVSRIDPRWEGTIPAFFAYDSRGKLRGTLLGEVTRSSFDRFVGGLTGRPR